MNFNACVEKYKSHEYRTGVEADLRWLLFLLPSVISSCNCWLKADLEEMLLWRTQGSYNNEVCFKKEGKALAYNILYLNNVD